MAYNAQPNSSTSSSSGIVSSLSAGGNPYAAGSMISDDLLIPQLANIAVEQGHCRNASAAFSIDPHFELMMMLDQQQRPSSRCTNANGPPFMQMMLMQQHVHQQSRKLFIGGLGQINDDALRQYYSQWGQVVDCIVIRDPATRSSRGFGFVTYATAEMADVAMAHRPHIINGKAVDAKRAVPRERMNLILDNDPIPFFMNIEAMSGCRLQLSGLNWEWHTLDTLRSHFGRFGTVEQLEMVAFPRGCGSLVYEEESAAQLCMAAGDKHSINGHPVEVKMVVADALFAHNLRPNSSDSALSASSARQQQSSGALDLL